LKLTEEISILLSLQLISYVVISTQGESPSPGVWILICQTKCGIVKENNCKLSSQQNLIVVKSVRLLLGPPYPAESVQEATGCSDHPWDYCPKNYASIIDSSQYLNAFSSVFFKFTVSGLLA